VISIKEELEALNPQALLADGFEDALIGWGMQATKMPVAIYNYDKCVEILINEGSSQDDAIEWMEYNVTNAWYGEGTPIFMREA
jgi:hypothetical protein